MTERTMRVQFLEDRTVLDHNNQAVESFKKGRVYTLAVPSALRWINRNAAIEAAAGRRKPRGAEDDAGSDAASSDEGSGVSTAAAGAEEDAGQPD